MTEIPNKDFIMYFLRVFAGAVGRMRRKYRIGWN